MKIIKRMAIFPVLFLTAVSLLVTGLPAKAAPLDISNVPLFLLNSVKPNVIIAIDNSGSMDFEVLMSTNDGAMWWHEGDKSFVGRDEDDNLVGGNTLNYNKNGNDNNTWNKTLYLFPNGSGTGNRNYNDGSGGNTAVPPIPEYAYTRCYTYNKAYFNPAVTYDPWASDGTDTFPDMSPTAAKSDPERGSHTFDLTQDIEEDSSGFTFRMWDGMVIPAGTEHKIIGVDPSFHTNSTDITITSAYEDVAISYFPATFFLPTGTSLPSGYGYTATPVTDGEIPDGTVALDRYEIKPGNFSNSTAYDEAIQNFANWYSYYRKRYHATRAGIGLSFSGVNNLRIGYFYINNRPSTITMRDLGVSSDVIDFYDFVYDLSPSGGTPNKQSVERIGELYMESTATWAPITEECQQNFAILFTDGFSNVYNPGIGNWDDDPPFGGVDPYTDSVDNTMADIAMKYYATNLRPGLTPTGRVPIPAACNGTNPDPSLDCNEDLHMVFFAVTLGAKGEIFNVDTAKTNDPYANITASDWPTSFFSRHPSSVDDLWHATINGRGELLNANAPSDIREKLTDVLNEIAARTATLANIATNTTKLTTETLVFQALFNSEDWSGHLLAFPLGTNATLGSELWDAADQLPGHSVRDVFTWDSNATTPEGIEFLWTNLNAGQQGYLNINPDTNGTDSLGQDRLNYVRGDQSNEEQNGGSFRDRDVLLGDIINSNPFFVGRFDFGYDELPGTEGTEYITYRSSTAYQNRTPMVYVGANDGMLHGFEASSNATSGGVEKFAYIPDAVIENLSELTSPDYNHLFFVDGSPRASDAYIDVGSGDEWRTVLVGSTGAGGRAVFALDVTDPDNFSAGDVLWEFSNDDDGDLGYTIGEVTLGRVQGSTGDEKWVAIFGNGYNSDNHRAVLFIVNLEDGSIIKKFDTGVGSLSNPNGLSSPIPVDEDSDRIIDSIYAGDLHGNMWKFDVDHSNRSQWDIAYSSGGTDVPLFKATNSTGGAQPITARPEVGRHPDGGVMVYFGTGKFFENGDNIITNPTENTFYGVWDDGSTSDLRRSDLQEQTIDEEVYSPPQFPNFNIRVVSQNSVNYTGTTPPPNVHGWYIDLISPVHGLEGERVVTRPVLRAGTQGTTKIIFSTLIPSQDPCDVGGGKSWIMELNALTGGRLDYSVFDLNQDGSVDDNDFWTDSSGNKWPVSGFQINDFGHAGTPAVIGAGTLEYKVIGGSSGKIAVVTEAGTGVDVGRQSWRELQ